MTRVATQRLIEASAKLGPDDRALLSLLVNHGLDDAALARLTRAGRAEVAARRELLAERLGAVLELPSATVQNALGELANAAGGQRPRAEPEATDGNHTNSAAPTVQAGAAAAAATETAPQPAATEPGPSPRDNRRRRAPLALMAVGLAIALVLVIALSSSGGGPAKVKPNAGTKPAGKNSGTANRSPVSAHRTITLVGLPGGSPGVTGTVALVGSATSPRLTVTVSRLPSAGTGHYEAWLYNSVIDSAPLSPLSPSGGTGTVQLPSNYRRYRWVDVSLQPAGSVTHSGESILRAALPH